MHCDNTQTSAGYSMLCHGILRRIRNLGKTNITSHDRLRRQPAARWEGGAPLSEEAALGHALQLLLQPRGAGLRGEDEIVVVELRWRSGKVEVVLRPELVLIADVRGAPGLVTLMGADVRNYDFDLLLEKRAAAPRRSVVRPLREEAPPM